MEFKIEIPDGYHSLIPAIQAAVDRCAVGKGKQRHQEYAFQPFDQQQIMRFTHGFRTDQIQKKAAESLRLKKPDAANEMLDCAIYAFAEWLVLQREISENREKHKARPAKLKLQEPLPGQMELEEYNWTELTKDATETSE